jgi:predicted nuclease with TOPRIM domain
LPFGQASFVDFRFALGLSKLSIARLGSKTFLVVSQLTREVSELTEIISQLTREVSELTKFISQLTREVSELTEIISQLTREVSELTKFISQITREVSELTKINSQLTREVSELTKINSQLIWKLGASVHFLSFFQINDSCGNPALRLKNGSCEDDEPSRIHESRCRVSRVGSARRR